MPCIPVPLCVLSWPTCVRGAKHVQYTHTLTNSWNYAVDEEAILLFVAQTVNKDLRRAHGEDTCRLVPTRGCRHGHITCCFKTKQAGTALHLEYVQTYCTYGRTWKEHTRRYESTVWTCVCWFAHRHILCTLPQHKKTQLTVCSTGLYHSEHESTWLRACG